MEKKRQTAYSGEEESQAGVRGEWKKDFTAKSVLFIRQESLTRNTSCGTSGYISKHVYEKLSEFMYNIALSKDIEHY